MTPTDKIDAALDSVLKAAGLSSACSYIYTLYAMRDAMRKIMVESYIAGSNDAHDVVMKGK